jgi:putative mycofactocin binding protein MftB
VSTTTGLSFDPSLAWSLSEKVSLREEDFGALAYHHDTRRLVFLKSPALVALVRHLHNYDSAEAAIDAVVGADQHARYVEALASLAASEILRER